MTTKPDDAFLERDEQGRIQSESAAMRLFRRFGRDDLAWPLRRLHVPVSSEALVLEVGSGGNPFPRSNVLLDAYESTPQRYFQPLISDRPTVLGLLENLPFRDGAFDFVIACHVLEHSPDVEAAIRELQRVAKAGYIETPDALFERVHPYRDHRLELTDRNGELRIRQKQDWVIDPELKELVEAQLRPSRGWGRMLLENAFAFHLRYYWSRTDGGIRYHLERAPAPPKFEVRGEEDEPLAPKRGLRPKLIQAARSLLSQRSRNARLELLPLLRCPTCRAVELKPDGDAVLCAACGARYPRGESFVRIFPRKDAPAAT